MQINIEQLILSPEQSQQYREGKQRFFVVLRAEYDDAMHQRHWTQACYSRKFNDALAVFTYYGGNIDSEK